MQRLLYEIREQPEVLQRLLDAERDRVREIAAEIQRRDIRYVLIAARGSSDNAALYAKYLLGTLNHLPVALAAPSMYTVYEAPPRLESALVLAISQSGMSPDIVAVVRDARERGMFTVAITNSGESPLADAAGRIILCHAGEERSVAATKTYTAELAAVALLSTALAGDGQHSRDLDRLPQAAQATLGLDGYIGAHTDRYRYMADCAVIARGYNYATAFEVALKLKELTYVGANPYSSADFLHGPIAVVERGYPVVLIAPSGAVYPELLRLARDLDARDAELIVISDEGEIVELAETGVRLPERVPEWLSPVTAVIPGQLLAYHLALSKRLDPDNPRGLHKVTETR